MAAYSGERLFILRTIAANMSKSTTTPPIEAPIATFAPVERPLWLPEATAEGVADADVDDVVEAAAGAVLEAETEADAVLDGVCS